MDVPFSNVGLAVDFWVDCGIQCFIDVVGRCPITIDTSSPTAAAVFDFGDPCYNFLRDAACIFLVHYEYYFRKFN